MYVKEPQRREYNPPHTWQNGRQILLPLNISLTEVSNMKSLIRDSLIKSDIEIISLSIWTGRKGWKSVSTIDLKLACVLAECRLLQEIAPFVKILGCYHADETNSYASSPVVETGTAAQQLGASQNGTLPAKAVTDDSENLLISAANVLPIQQVICGSLHPIIELGSAAVGCTCTSPSPLQFCGWTQNL